ncbi:MAG: DUF11 domain-containing protein [Propionibacteriaceae bacterium]|jgi:uncharacterized repeat protein (TIGR01451 family)|nr:DUF11 domain-containing protein [Propionibacteriaceae bacterium]
MSTPTASLSSPSHPRRRAASGRRWTACLLGSALAVLGLAGPVVSHPKEAAAVPPFPIDALTPGPGGAGVDGWDTVTNSDPSGAGHWTSDGWLRLTADRGGSKTAVTNKTAFPSGTGFEVSFDYRMANGGYTDNDRTGDGLAFFIIDDFDPVTGQATQATIGHSGAGLGYSIGKNLNETGRCGVRMGYLGLGLDARGNYASTTLNYSGDDSLGSESLIGLRGPGLGGNLPQRDTCPTSAGSSITANPRYPWITGARVPDLITGFDMGQDPALQSNSLYRRVLIRVVPVPAGVEVAAFMGPAKVKSVLTNQNELVQKFRSTLSGSYSGMTLPTNMRIGFSASTGDATNYQDIRNVKIVSVGDLAAGAALHASTPGDPAGSFNPGQPASFSLTATNNGPTIVGNSTPASYPGNRGYARLASDLSALPLTDVKWTCEAHGGAVCLTPSGSGPLVKADWTGPKGSYITVKVDAVVGAGNGVYTVKAVVPTDFTNNIVDPRFTAVQADQGLDDTNLNNNTATVGFRVLQPALDLAKTVSPNNPASFILGQQLTYTFTVKNNATAAMTGVTVEETAFTGTGTLSALTYVWPDPSQPGVLASGATATATAHYTITEGDVKNGRIDNTAIAKGQLVSTSTQVVSPPASARVQDASSAAIALDKTADASQLSSPPKVGDIISYTLTCRNTSTKDVFNIDIKDSRPNVTPLQLTWTGSKENVLEPGDALIATTTYAISQADIDNGKVHNTALCTAFAKGESGDSKLEATAEATVDLAPQQPAVLHIRQIVSRPAGSLRPVPVTGYAVIVINGQVVNLVMASGEAASNVPYTAYAIAPPVAQSYSLKVTEPQFYDYTGFIATATAQEQAGQPRQPGPPVVSYAAGDVQWLTVYLEADSGSAQLGYDWSTWTNDFGHVKTT